MTTQLFESAFDLTILAAESWRCNHPQQPLANASRCLKAYQQPLHKSTFECVNVSTQAMRRSIIAPQSEHGPPMPTLTRGS